MRVAAAAATAAALASAEPSRVYLLVRYTDIANECCVLKAAEGAVVAHSVHTVSDSIGRACRHRRTHSTRSTVQP